MPVVAPTRHAVRGPDSAVFAPETTPATASAAGDEAAPATSACPGGYGRSGHLGRSGRLRRLRPLPAVVRADEGGTPAWAQLGMLLGATLLATGAAGMIASARRRSLRAQCDDVDGGHT